MKTNIEIDGELLKEAMKFSKLSSNDAVINFVLEKYVKFQKKKLLVLLRGKVKWEGNLDEMRTYDKWEDS